MPHGIYQRNIHSIADRFWAMVEKNGPVPDHRKKLGRCWMWTGCITPNGYGQINRGDHTIAFAHRVAYEIQNGKIEMGLDVMHECDNRACVRGIHLAQGTRSKNISDCVRRGRFVSHWGKRTHCKNGHLFTGEKKPGNQGRRCRTCIHDRDIKYRAEKMKK